VWAPEPVWPLFYTYIKSEVILYQQTLPQDTAGGGGEQGRMGSIREQVSHSNTTRRNNPEDLERMFTARCENLKTGTQPESYLH